MLVEHIQNTNRSPVPPTQLIEIPTSLGVCGMGRSLRPHAPFSPRLRPRVLFGRQVLGQVEAHIDALRAQLQKETPGLRTLSDNGGPCLGGGGRASFSPPVGPQCPQHPVAIAETATTSEVGCVDGAPINSGGGDTTMGTIPPLSMETRGNYYFSPTPAERSGNEGGLTEVEDMRLNRLLRTSKSSTSSTPPPPSGEFTIGQRGTTNHGGSGGKTGNGDRLATVMTDHPVPSVLAGGTSDVCRELFGTSPTPGNGDGSGNGWARGKDAFVATRRNRSFVDDEADDLDDISDGGFHSGCWRRKYIRGEMR